MGNMLNKLQPLGCVIYSLKDFSEIMLQKIAGYINIAHPRLIKFVNVPLVRIKANLIFVAFGTE